jgi:cell wall-associated NlpC family hydrolase
MGEVRTLPARGIGPPRPRAGPAYQRTGARRAICSGRAVTFARERSMRIPLSLVLASILVVTGCASTPAPASSSNLAVKPSENQASRAADVALAMVGKPYRYGGSTPKGFDCSGLVNYSFAQAGLQVSRDTRTLRDQAVLIPVSALRRGDLVFFDQEGKKYSHVGIYLGDGVFVHAPSSGGKVRTDDLGADYWSRHFVEARRI